MTTTENTQSPTPTPATAAQRSEQDLMTRWMAAEREPREPDDRAWDPDEGSGLNGHLVIGIIALLVGLLITVVTYSNASGASGGTYVVAYGPMAYGVVSIIRGLARS